jgi:catechol 2,3-dioxygenase-like lactoylglutathione lyase family enzyme
LAIQLDHLILTVNDASASVAFYAGVLGLAHEGEDGPFSVMRVTPALQLLLAPWGTKGGGHLAFSMSRAEFDAVFATLIAAKIPYGDSFHSVGNMREPGDERGARGTGKVLYFFDPNQHLIEIRHYEAISAGGGLSSPRV